VREWKSKDRGERKSRKGTVYNVVRQTEYVLAGEKKIGEGKNGKSLALSLKKTHQKGDLIKLPRKIEDVFGEYTGQILGSR